MKETTEKFFLFVIRRWTRREDFSSLESMGPQTLFCVKTQLKSPGRTGADVHGMFWLVLLERGCWDGNYRLGFFILTQDDEWKTERPAGISHSVSVFVSWVRSDLRQRRKKNVFAAVLLLLWHDVHKGQHLRGGSDTNWQKVKRLVCQSWFPSPLRLHEG